MNSSLYHGALTREQFLFYEIRIVAKLILKGHNRKDILDIIKDENLFQFPTEKMISSITGTCFRRIDALDSETLIYRLILRVLNSRRVLILPAAERDVIFKLLKLQFYIRIKSNRLVKLIINMQS